MFAEAEQERILSESGTSCPSFVIYVTHNSAEKSNALELLQMQILELNQHVSALEHKIMCTEVGCVYQMHLIAQLEKTELRKSLTLFHKISKEVSHSTTLFCMLYIYIYINICLPNDLPNDDNQLTNIARGTKA